MLTRDHFDGHAGLPAMDAAAVLILAAGALWQARAEFEHLGADEAAPHANTAIKALRKAARDLISAATSREPDARMRKVREEHMKHLVKAAVAVRWMARREQALNDSSGGPLTKKALAPLLKLLEDWGGPDARARYEALSRDE